MVSAPVQSIDGPFVPASADQPLDVGLHQQLQDALGHSTQKVTVASLLQKLIQWQSLLGHRGFSGQCEVEQLHPRPPAAVTTPAPLPDRHVFPPPIPPEITPRPWTLPKIDTGIQVYFCDPQSPWQPGANENTIGLLRQYFPKGTDLSTHSAETIAAVAATLNARPRKTLGWKTPAEELDQWLP